MSQRQTQQAFETADCAVGPLEARIYQTMYTYLRDELGLPEETARARAADELTDRIGRNVCAECESMGLRLAGLRVLDLGAGLGGLTAEMARRGALTVGVEPGAGWSRLARERAAAAGKAGVVSAVGEHLPIADASLDLVVSLQVLEHVDDPNQVIGEVFRVLKPGGHFMFSYENYYSFFEPHFQVRWLPLLPKPLGAAYLRSRGCL